MIGKIEADTAIGLWRGALAIMRQLGAESVKNVRASLRAIAVFDHN